MEPLGYAQVVRRWWWLIVGLVLGALIIVYLVSPANYVDRYEATHVLLVESDRESGNSSEANPEVVALWARDSEVLERAAAAIGPTVSAQRLERDIDVTTNRNVGTVSITATDINPERAALKANTVAAETVAFLTEQATSRNEAKASDLAAQEQSLRERIALLDAAIANNPPDVETRTAERDALIRQLGQVLEDQAAQVSSVTFTSVEEPTRGSKEDRLPGTRGRTERMLLAAGVALVLGFGLALVLDRSDTRVRNRRTAEELYGLPVIAEIVKFPFWTRRRRTAVVRQPDTAVAESYRTLRSAVMLHSPDVGDRWSGSGPAPTNNGDRMPRRGEAIMIASTGSGDGKTTTAANLAAAFGESGQSVLVLSLDFHRFRRGRRSKQSRRPGVAEFLAADPPIPLTSVVVNIRVPNVSVVEVGGGARPPGGQLVAQRRLLEEARALADVVLVDTAPLPASSVCREMASIVDSVVALCRVGRTSRTQAEQCGDLLEQIDAPAIGVAMVGVTAPEGSEYFAYFTRRRDARASAARSQAAPSRPDEAKPHESSSPQPVDDR